jgi:membrane-bound metal-dependent hydrolase YbcI (DUF457 family)
MPFTLLHFGPAGFLGLVFKKWLDLPVFLLANVAIDVEVLLIYTLGLGLPVHRYCHTFLFSPLVALALAIVVYPLRGRIKNVLKIFYLSYETTFKKILISAVLGCWFHVLIDSFNHWDIKPFWPYRKNPFFNLITENHIKIICLAFLTAAFILWVFQSPISKKRR